MVDMSRLEMRSNDFARMEGRIDAFDAQTKQMEEDRSVTERSFESVSLSSDSVKWAWNWYLPFQRLLRLTRPLPCLPRTA